MCWGAYIPYFKINAPNSCCFIFVEEFLNLQVKIYKMLNEHTSKLPISPKQRFLKICFSPSREGEDYRAKNMTKIKLARVLVKSFDKFHHLEPSHFLDSVLLCHNLDSSILKCEGCLT